VSIKLLRKRRKRKLEAV